MDTLQTACSFQNYWWKIGLYYLFEYVCSKAFQLSTNGTVLYYSPEPYLASGAIEWTGSIVASRKNCKYM